MPVDILIEGFLFYKSAPQKKQVLMKLYGITAEELKAALELLTLRLKDGATCLVETHEDIQIVLKPDFAPIVEAMHKNELKADIGKAGAETLAIILYQEPISRAEIDRIRGVNSSFILRNLLIRGLIERKQSTSGSGYNFIISPSLLAYLGITNKLELPEFARITDSLEQFNTVVEDTIL